MLFAFGTRHFTSWTTGNPSLVVMALSLLAHLGITTHSGLAIYAVRVVFCTAVAGVYGASVTFIAAGTSPERMAEPIRVILDWLDKYLGPVQ